MATENSLGKTLSSVFAKTPRREQSGARGYREVDIGSVRPPQANPRLHFDQAAMDELAESIAEHGILQPIVVLKREGGFEVLAGERRYRAARQVGLQTIPVVVKDDLDERSIAELRIIENIQREDLDPIELAQAYRTLIDQHDLTQDGLAKRLGKGRASITNQLRLLSLPEPVTRQLASGDLTMGHAKALLGMTDAMACTALAARIASDGMSVRQAEQAVRQAMAEPASTGSSIAKPSARGPSPEIRELEANLAQLFGAEVTIRERGGRGTLSVHFHSKGHFKQVIGELDRAAQAAARDEHGPQLG